MREELEATTTALLKRERNDRRGLAGASEAVTLEGFGLRTSIGRVRNVAAQWDDCGIPTAVLRRWTGGEWSVPADGA
jgi:hypothetical protein